MYGAPDESVQSPSPLPEPGPEGAPAAPSLTLPADVATTLKGEHQCKPGDRYNLTVAIRSVGEDGSLTLDVPSDAQFVPAEAGAPTEESMDRFAGPTVLSGVGKTLED